MGNKKCFLAGLGDECSKEITKDHPTPKNMLQTIANEDVEKKSVYTTIYRDRPAKVLKKIGINSLCKHNLCKKHNNNLGFLDEKIGSLFSNINNVNRRIMQVKKYVSYNGRLIERALLKIVCSEKPDLFGEKFFKMLLFDTIWPTGLGLGVIKKRGKCLNSDMTIIEIPVKNDVPEISIMFTGIDIKIFFNKKTNMVSHCEYDINGICFILILEHNLCLEGYDISYRPQDIIFRCGQLNFYVNFMFDDFIDRLPIIINVLGLTQKLPESHRDLVFL